MSPKGVRYAHNDCMYCKRYLACHYDSCHAHYLITSHGASVDKNRVFGPLGRGSNSACPYR